MAAETQELNDLLHTTDFLKCPNCDKIFIEPLILPCLHSICRPCAQNYLKQHGSHNDLECPECNSKVKGQGQESEANGHGLLTENPFLKSLSELYDCQSAGSSKSCDYCRYDKKHVTATSRCLECHDNVCDACAEAHKRTKLTRHHKIAAFDQITLGRFDSDIRDFQNVECETHTDEQVKYLCKKCDQLICRECKVSDHEKHSCIDLDEACDRFRTKNEPILDRVKEKCTGLENYLQFLDGYHKYVGDNSEQVVELINTHAQKLHKMVDDYRDSLVQQIEQTVEQEKKTVAQRAEKAKDLVKTLDSSSLYIDTLLQHGKPDEILHSRKLVTERLTHLAHAQADSVTKKLHQYFRPSALTVKNMDTIFGKADSFHQSLNDDNVKDICHDTSIQITSALPMLSEDITLVREFLANGVSDIKDIWPTGIAINRNGQIFIVDRENKRIKLYDSHGKLESEFGHTGSGHLNCPYDITILRNDNVAVTDYHDEDVKIFTKSGHFVKSWHQGFKYPRGIGVNKNGQVMVVDVNCHQVTFHNQETGAIEGRIAGKMADGCPLFTDPYYITTNTKNFVIVTDWVSPNIKVFDTAGKMVNNYVTYGVGRDRVLQPYGICTDSYGYIFIADNQNHRVHLIGPDGKFLRFLLTAEHGLWHPMALAINQQGHLVVTEALGKVKVFKYM